MQIDVRKQNEEVKEIVFHDVMYTEGEACMLSERYDGSVGIRDGYGKDIVYLVSECQVKYLIKALEKSIELGWFQK